MRRRHFLLSPAACAVSRGASLSRKERIDRALKGTAVDRSPFSFWHHFHLKTPEEHAAATLQFHKDYRTDLVKVMSDFPYPQPKGKWYQLTVDANPFAPQIRALELIRDGLDGTAYFVETLFNSWHVAEKLSSPEEVIRLKNEDPQALLDALDVITQSQMQHVRRALATGAAGIFLSVANANSSILSPADYQRFSAPFDRRILESAFGARFSILHLHVEKTHLELFQGFPAAVISYSLHVSGIPVREVRSRYSAAIMGGLDEVHYRNLTAAELKAQWQSAREAAGLKFLLAPGCSVPDDSAREELLRLPKLLHA
jgi:uroporphyrinogen decarboxylase